MMRPAPSLPVIMQLFAPIAANNRMITGVEGGQGLEFGVRPGRTGDAEQGPPLGSRGPTLSR